MKSEQMKKQNCDKLGDSQDLGQDNLATPKSVSIDIGKVMK